MSRRESPTTVLYVMGAGRSGSTLLDLLLGSIPGYFSTGELRYLYQRCLLDGAPCACGQQVTACPVWEEVLRAAFGSPPYDRLAADMVRWQASGLRLRHAPLLALRGAGPSVSRAGLASRYLERHGSLHPAVARVTGSSVIVDSSKSAADAHLLARDPRLRTHVVFLVRDPRAVVYSWGRRKARPDTGAPDLSMAVKPAAAGALDWCKENAAALAVRRALPAGQVTLLRYEDLAADPRAALVRVLRAADLPQPADLPVDANGLAMLRPNHTVGGNPLRLGSTVTAVRPDTRWRQGLTRRDAAVTTLLTWPLLGPLGYPLAPFAGGGSPARR